jgi:hypothetical protein
MPKNLMPNTPYTKHSLAYSSNLKKEAKRSSEALVTIRLNTVASRTISTIHNQPVMMTSVWGILLKYILASVPVIDE